MIQIVSWILTIVSVAGAILNARKSIIGFYIWIVSNIAWSILDFSVGLPAQGYLFIVYTIITSYGIYQWRKKKETRDV